MRRVAIIQPGYLPWLGFFELMASSDILVIYDDVQFDKHGWRNRNRIKAPTGILWLTVPVLTKGMNFPLNKDVVIKDGRWRAKHLMSIQQHYRKAAYYQEIFPLLERGLTLPAERLIEVSMFFISEIARYLTIGTEIVLSSHLHIGGEGKAERLINICKHFNATHYYNGAAGKTLYRKEEFLAHDIILEFQEYQHPSYTQLYGEFIPYLSVIDLLFNEGKSSREVIESGRKVT